MRAFYPIRLNKALIFLFYFPIKRDIRCRMHYLQFFNNIIFISFK